MFNCILSRSSRRCFVSDTGSLWSRQYKKYMTAQLTFRRLKATLSMAKHKAAAFMLSKLMLVKRCKFY